MGNRVGGRPTDDRGGGDGDVVSPWHAIPRARGGPGEMDAEFASPDEGRICLTRAMLSTWFIPCHVHGKRCRKVKPGDPEPCRLTNEIVG